MHYLPLLANWFIRSVGATLRIRQVNAPSPDGAPFVYGFWHGEQFILCSWHKEQNMAIMSSLSRDGELQKNILKRLGFTVIRGSSSKGGERALVEMIRAVRAGNSAAFAVDGPRGPLHVVKPGVLFLAQKSRRFLVPASSAARKHAVLSKAWDRYEFPRPWSQGVVAYGNPVEIKPDDTIEDATAQFQRALERLSQFTHTHYWGNDIGAYLSYHPRPRILIVQPSRIGDVVFTLPSVVALRERFPHAWIGWVVDERCAPVIQGHPDLDEVIVFDRRNRALSYIRDFRRRLRKLSIDLSIDFHGLFKSAFLVSLAGARFRIGSASTYGMKELAWLFSKQVPAPSLQSHCIERHYSVAHFLGCEGTPEKYHLPVNEAARAEVRQLMVDAGIKPDMPVVAVHPGGGWLSRRWPAERFARVCDRLVNEALAQVVLIGGREGGAGEAGLNDTIMARVSVPVTDFTGKMTLPQLIAFLSEIALFVGNEAGPMHLAVALGRPTIGIIGPTNPARTGPFGGITRIVRAQMPCQPCRNRHCATRECMDKISVDDVYDAACAMLVKRS